MNVNPFSYLIEKLESAEAILTIYTSGKTLNTPYTENLPTGFTQDNSLITGIMYSVFYSNYSSIDIAKDSNLLMEISIDSGNKLHYKLIGQYTCQGKLTISLKKI